MVLSEPDTVRSCLQSGTAQLQARGIANPSLDAALLLAHALHQPRSWLYAYPEYRLTDQEKTHWQSCLDQRLSFRPLAYIVSKKEFMGLVFQVDERVLIPRPETELLVELALAWLDQTDVPAPRVVDVGTGSGCIALSLAHAWSQIDLVGIDLSAEALQVARHNSRHLNLQNRVTWRQGNLLEPMTEPASLVLANLPYVSCQEWTTLMPDITDYEPSLALRSDEDGLAHTRRLVAMLPGRLQTGASVLLECGAGQSVRVRRLLEQSGLFAQVSVYNDLAGIGRCVAGWNAHPESPSQPCNAL